MLTGLSQDTTLDGVSYALSRGADRVSMSLQVVCRCEHPDCPSTLTFTVSHMPDQAVMDAALTFQHWQPEPLRCPRHKEVPTR